MLMITLIELFEWGNRAAQEYGGVRVFAFCAIPANYVPKVKPSTWTMNTFAARPIEITLKVGVIYRNGIHVEWPIKYPHNGEIAYDHPELIPKYVRKHVERAYKWIESDSCKRRVKRLTEILNTFNPVKELQDQTLTVEQAVSRSLNQSFGWHPWDA